MKNLVVVESPTKARTLSRFLGKDYQIEASKGHIKDLPKKELGVDVERNFEPNYVVIPRQKKTVKELREAAAGAAGLYLATDPDREGEAIAQHVAEVLKGPALQRVVFHEITADAVKEAFAHPRSIDLDLVDAQKARRVLDRLVGYKLSPLLWKKVRYGLSAGRVQSVAVRLIVEREREREAFKPEEYWKIEARLRKKDEFTALLIKKDDKKLEIKNRKQADTILKDLKDATYLVRDIKTEEKLRYPSPPFTTSTLQQTAFGRLGFSSKRTMRAAQSLYERGLITYHRTDSTNLAKSALSQIRGLIEKEYGQQYLTKSAKVYKTKAKVAQEAHEAIRPTAVGKFSIFNFQFSKSLGKDEKRLYELIWRRTVACQMKPAVFDQTRVDINADSYLFRAEGSVLTFDGFLRVWKDSIKEVGLPKLAKSEEIELIKLTPSQHFTQPPARYTEATLIKELEKNGIGRPSTYAPTISTIIDRGYVSREGRNLKPEDVGFVVNDLLVEHFPKVVDLQFTARMEEDLDEIAGGKKRWVPIVKSFYEPFDAKLKIKSENLKRSDFNIIEETEEKCPECGKPLVVKLGRYGKFLSCSHFPECKFRKSYLEKIGMKCPTCGEGEVIVKRTKRGKIFWGCSRYPDCDWASWKNPKTP